MSDTPDTPEPGAGDAADPGFGGGADASAEANAEAAVEDAVASISVEDLVVDLERVSSERDEYLDGLRRVQAEFENYRKAVAKREADAKERANDKIVNELLPVLDACDGAVANGATDVEPIRNAILDNLSRQGLQRLEPAGEIFDPELHEAVMHEASADVEVPTVAEVLRVGYGWNGRVLRPAMVKTIG